MISDLNSDSIGGLDGKLFDVCICGAGPAGITAARKLASKGKSVALVEAGGFDYSEQSQSLYSGTQSGLKMYDPLTTSRLRYFGGTSNHWAGRCGLFDPIDFEPATYHGLPGWPISWEETYSHLEEAKSILDLDGKDLRRRSLGAWKNGDFDYASKALSPPTRFGVKYRKELIDSKAIHVFLNANLTNIRLADLPQNARVEYVEATSYKNRTIKLKARNYVLAMGAVENARMLLNFDSQLQGGIGNHSGYLGACFMEHFNVGFGRFVGRQETFVAQDPELSPSEQLLRQKKIGNAVIALDGAAEVQEYGRTAKIKSVVRNTVCASDTVTEFARRFQDFNCQGDGVISSMVEQAPDKNNKISLASQKDQFGLRKAHLHWDLNEFDKKTIRALGLELAKDMARHDLARVKLADFILDPQAPFKVFYHAHHLGTTRMSKDPGHGVVNPDCLVHGLRNLYVAGSSVFPTGGGINPTLTLVALALRLGQHLAEKQ